MLFFFFLNGLHHGLGADHVMALSNILVRGGRLREVSLMGLSFGLGHMGVLILLGGAALLFNFTIPDQWERNAEIFGGGLLILLGAWTFAEWLREVGYIHSHTHSHGHGKEHEHYHFHFHGRHPHQHVHAHLSTLLGGLFALSGVRALLLMVVPILEVRSLYWALGYIVVFGIGIVVSMTAFGLLAGSALNRTRHRSRITLLLSASSVTLGAYWIYSS